MKVIREPPGNPEALYPIGTIRNPDLVAKSWQCRIVLPRLRSREWCPCSCSWTLLVTLGPNRVAGAWMDGKERRRPDQSDVSGPAPRDSPEGGDPSAASVYGRYKGILGQSLFDVVDSHAIGSRMQGRSSMIEEARDEYRGWAKRARTLQTSSRRWSRVAFVCAGLAAILGAAASQVTGGSISGRAWPFWPPSRQRWHLSSAARSCRWTAKRGGSVRERRQRQ